MLIRAGENNKADHDRSDDSILCGDRIDFEIFDWIDQR